MTYNKLPLTAYTVSLDFVQIRDLVLQMPENERKLIYGLLQAEFENKNFQLYSEEELENMPDEEPEVSDEQFYESLKHI
ncbi:MAG: hypothetical protein HC803_00505 [Saprospiraceae bacterium]|nr:hypothetical protein [Saprospiraceae bacterium]